MKPKLPVVFTGVLIMVSGLACNTGSKTIEETDNRIHVIFDTDANNELDDQHALAYLLLNEETFNTIGVTVNATRSGGEIGEHVKEAKRVVHLCDRTELVPVFSGANANFLEIRNDLDGSNYDGRAAVEFIISEAMKKREETLVVLAVGKLTNVALALEKEPAIADKIRLVWLGSNYPEPGEYNQDNDTASMSYVLNSKVPFEMVTVRNGTPSGTAAVVVSRMEINEKMPGAGPHVADPVPGRHGGSYTNFGDYSVSLFQNIDHLGEGETRALFDMAAVAIVKEPSWANSVRIPCPILINNQWKDQPENERDIMVWEDFDRENILADFFSTLGIK